MQSLTISFVQQQTSSQTATPIEQTIAGIHQAVKLKAELVVLQELHNSIYFCQVEDPSYFALAETIPGPTTQILGQIAKQHQIVIVSSVFEKRAPGIYHNTAVVLDKDGEIAGLYRKMHIPDDPGYYEKYYFTPGDLGFKPIDTSVGRLGVLICWDQWYPEAARLMALNGANLLIYPTAIGWDPNDSSDIQRAQTDAWITMQRAHAISNGLPVISCNRVGFEVDPSGVSDGQQFWGSSFIADQQGQILTIAPNDKAAVQVATLNLSLTETLRQTWPFLRDRRIDAYDGLLKRYLDEN